MSYQPTPKEAFVLWRLLITKEEPAISMLRPKFRIREAAPLVTAGLLTLEKRGASTHVVLTDKAWDWASEQTEIKLPPITTAATPVLARLLESIGRYLKTHNTPISELLADQLTQDIDSRVRDAYLEISGGRYAERVRLSQLRNYFDDCPKAELDEALIRMTHAKQLSLMRFDDPQEIKPEDEQSALESGGQNNHIIYMKA